jgi:hypothetical protein
MPSAPDDDVGLDLAAVCKAHHPTAIAAGSKAEVNRSARTAVALSQWQRQQG